MQNIEAVEHLENYKENGLGSVTHDLFVSEKKTLRQYSFISTVARFLSLFSRSSLSFPLVRIFSVLPLPFPFQHRQAEQKKGIKDTVSSRTSAAILRVIPVASGRWMARVLKERRRCWRACVNSHWLRRFIGF